MNFANRPDRILFGICHKSFSAERGITFKHKAEAAFLLSTQRKVIYSES